LPLFPSAPDVRAASASAHWNHQATALKRRAKPEADAMMNRMSQLIRSEEGQGMTEYIIMVALIAIAAIAVITFFGQNLRGLFSAAGNAIGGEEANANVSASGGGRTGVQVQRKGIKNMGSNNLGKE
jgi:Flp pilus assembly pilin Flp